MVAKTTNLFLDLLLVIRVPLLELSLALTNILATTFFTRAKVNQPGALAVQPLSDLVNFTSIETLEGLGLSENWTCYSASFALKAASFLIYSCWNLMCFQQMIKPR